MVRVILTNLILFLLPFILYAVYIKTSGRGVGQTAGEIWQDAPVLTLLATGMVLVFVAVVAFASFTGGDPAGHYRPPVYQGRGDQAGRCRMTGAAMAGQPPARIRDAEWLERAETQAVFAAITAGGYAARAVGGSVRNALMGVPVTDVDISTTARRRRSCDWPRRRASRPCPPASSHGTVTVVSGHIPFEVTTLRRDVETFGRHANVAFTEDWSADAGRRDFTINALYCDADGTVFDPLGGYQDLLARRVRFIGEPSERIREDYLRILRFFRFNATYGDGPLDRDGLLACVRERAGLRHLSAERIRSELVRLLVAPRALAALEAMLDWGLLVDTLGSVPWLGTLARLVAIEEGLGAAPDAMARLAALCVRIEEDVLRLTARLRLSNAERDALACVTGPLPPTGMSEMEARAALYRAGVDCFRRRLLQGWAFSGDPPERAFWRALHGLPEAWPVPRFPLTGRHLERLGIASGPRMGRVLREVEARWIEGGFRARVAELETMAREIAAGLSD